MFSLHNSDGPFAIEFKTKKGIGFKKKIQDKIPHPQYTTNI